MSPSDGARRAARAAAPLAVAAIAIGVAVLPADVRANPHGIVGYATLGAICHAANASADVRVLVEGLPDAWRAGATYRLVVGVVGGPSADLTRGGHAGGFDMRASAGELRPPAGSSSVMRSVRGGTYHDMTAGGHGETPFPEATWGEVTFTHKGANARRWEVDFEAPDAGAGDVRLEVAGLAANGDHSASTADAWAIAAYVVPEGEPLPFIERYGALLAWIGGGATVVSLATWGALRLGGPRQPARRPTAKGGRIVSCPTCGTDVREANLREHERRAHARAAR